MSNTLRIGIVGADGRKWSSEEQEILVRENIRQILSAAITEDARNQYKHMMKPYPEGMSLTTFIEENPIKSQVVLVSGHCPVGMDNIWCHRDNRFVGIIAQTGRVSDWHDPLPVHKHTEVYDQGGVDSWAEIIADSLGIRKEIYPAPAKQWDDMEVEQGWALSEPPKLVTGFRSRNIKIAEASNILYVISPIRVYNRPAIQGCHYCPSYNHVQNGGCWTGRYAEKLGKKVVRIVI